MANPLLERLIALPLAWAVCAFAYQAPADTVSDRLAVLERDVAAIKAVVQIPATQPATQPTPSIVVARADSLPAVRAAIANGATLIQTTGFDLSEALDARGVTIELLPGGPGWKPAVQLYGNAELSNATIKTPPSTFNAGGHRIGFSKAVVSNAKAGKLINVTFAPDTGFCIHVGQGRLDVEEAKATTFSEYFVYQEAGTYVYARRCAVLGGSKAESIYRATGARYLIEDCIFDNSRGGKAALRGDCPAFPDGSPGGVVRRTKFVGQVGPNPLTEDDGGQAIGIDRWRFAEGWLYQLDGSRKAETIAYVQELRRAGKTPEQIVRATADRFIDPVQFAKVAKGRTRLSDYDVALTLAFRKAELSRSASFFIEDCEIVGDLRLNARMSGTVRNTTIAAGPTTPISGASQTTYPWPIDRVMSADEIQPAPAVIFDNVVITGGNSLGIDLKAYPGLKFNAATYNGKALKAEAVQ